MSVVQGNLASEERRQWLLDALAGDGAVTITAAVAALGVSEMTIRRDLAELEELGVARRVRGGAKAIGPQSLAERRHTRPRAKSRVAAKLLDLVPSSGVVAFDASSTLMRLAGLLESARDLTVLTNGPDTFSALHNRPGITPLLTGGHLEPRTGSLVGPLACRAASQFLVHTLFTSAAAVDPARGALESTLDEAEVKRSMAGGAASVVLAVDSSKLGVRGVAVGVEWARVDLLVTELDPADRRLSPYRELTEVR